MAQMWHYLQNAIQHGPISEADLKQLAATSKLQVSDMVWTQGMAQWVAAGSVAELFAAPSPPVATMAPPPPIKAALLTPAMPAKAVRAEPVSPSAMKGAEAAPTQGGQPGVVANIKKRLQAEEPKALLQQAKVKWQGASTPAKAGIVGGAAVGGFLLLLVFCIVPLWWFFGGWGRPAITASKEAKIGADGPMPVRELLQSFLDNREETEKKYLDKTVTVTGVIEDVMNKEGNRVILETGSVKGRVLCTFSLKHAKRLLELGKGSEIELRGKCNELHPFRPPSPRDKGEDMTPPPKDADRVEGLVLDDCELLEKSAGDGGGKKIADREAARDSGSSKSADGPMPVRELLQGFLDNREESEKKYLHKTMIVTGVMEDVTNKEGNEVRLETGSVQGSVFCIFSLKYAKRIMQLGKGSEIVLRGKCNETVPPRPFPKPPPFPTRPPSGAENLPQPIGAERITGLLFEDCELLEGSAGDGGGEKSGDAGGTKDSGDPKQSGSGRITKANFNMIQTGMTLPQVEEILGPGNQQANAGVQGQTSDVYTWQEGLKIISINFMNGKVVAKVQIGL